MAISFRYALALFCLIFARKSDLGSYRSFPQLFKMRSTRPVQPAFTGASVRSPGIVASFFWVRRYLYMRRTASHSYSHIKVSGLPKTALPQDVQRLVQSRNLENVSGSELVNFYSCPVTLLVPFRSSIHGLQSFSADWSRLPDTIVPEFYDPELANAEQGDNVIPVALRHGGFEPFSSCEDAGTSWPPGSC